MRGGQARWSGASRPRQIEEHSMMKRFFAICMVLSLVTVFVGCDKKAEVKKTTTVSTPEGTTTKTDTSTIKTDKAAP
jgi:hypothetical protein